jgi:hypothetical protein
MRSQRMLRSEIGIRRGRNPAASIGAEDESILHPIEPGRRPERIAQHRSIAAYSTLGMSRMAKVRALCDNTREGLERVTTFP